MDAAQTISSTLRLAVTNSCPAHGKAGSHPPKETSGSFRVPQPAKAVGNWNYETLHATCKIRNTNLLTVHKVRPYAYSIDALPIIGISHNILERAPQTRTQAKQRTL